MGRIICMLTTIIVLILVTGCNQIKKVNLYELITKDIDNISLIEVRNGETGELIKITKKEKIDEFLVLFKDINIQKEKDDKIKGFSYSMMINNNHYVLLGDTLSINGEYYKADNEIPLNDIEIFLKTLQTELE